MQLPQIGKLLPQFFFLPSKLEKYRDNQPQVLQNIRKHRKLLSPKWSRPGDYTKAISIIVHWIYIYTSIKQWTDTAAVTPGRRSQERIRQDPPDKPHFDTQMETPILYEHMPRTRTPQVNTLAGHSYSKNTFPPKRTDMSLRFYQKI